MIALLCASGCPEDDRQPVRRVAAEPEVPRRPLLPFAAEHRERHAIEEALPEPEEPPEPEDPCLKLAAAVCELFGVGSEECQEVRARVRQMAPERGRVQCEEALRAHEAGELLEPRESPCKVFVARRCAQLGENTDGCQMLRRTVRRMKEEVRERACTAELLVLKGLEPH